MRHAWLGLLVLCACGPNPPAPVKVMAIVPSTTGQYEARQINLTTIGNITALKGSIAEFVGGNRVVTDPNDPLQSLNGGIANMTDDQRYEVIVKDKGRDVRGDFVERAGILWPADFHTWNMVTTYYNFEQAYLYYQQTLAADPPELQKMRVMYWPEVRLNAGEPLTDNALFLSFVKSFVIVPFKTGDRIPLAMNLGVIGHEVGHKVFNHRVLQDAGIHPALTSWNMQPFNLLKSLDEGLADFNGFSVTCTDAAGCRPAFLAVSLSDDKTVKARDVSRPDACMDANLRSAFNTSTPDVWVQLPELYGVGNLIASTLYQAGNKAGKIGVMQKAVLAAYDDESAATPGLSQLVNRNINNSAAFTPEAVMNVIASHITDPQLLNQFCGEAVDRLQLNCPTFKCDLMPACPPTARRGTSCPVLPTP